MIFSANCCRSGLPAILKEYAFYFVLFFLLLLSLPGMFFLPYSSGKFMLIFENSAQRYLVISDDNPIRPHQGSVCSCKAQKHPHPLVGLCSGVLWGSQNDRSGSTGLCGRLRAWPPQFPQLCLLMCWQPLWAGVRLPSDSGLPSLQDSGWKRMRGSLLSGRERRKRKEPSEPFPETSIPAFSCHIWTDNQQGGVPSLLGHQSAAAPASLLARRKTGVAARWWNMGAESGHWWKGGWDQQVRNGCKVCY